MYANEFPKRDKLKNLFRFSEDQFVLSVYHSLSATEQMVLRKDFAEHLYEKKYQVVFLKYFPEIFYDM